MTVRDPAVDTSKQAAPAAAPASPESETRSGASNEAPIPAESPPPSASPSEQNTGNNAQANAWFRSAFNTLRYGASPSVPEAQTAPGSAPESDRSADPKPAVPASAEGGEDVAPAGDDDQKKTPARKKDEDTVVLTQAELRRHAQAEADRILAKHQREEGERRRREEKRKARETDPYAFAQMEKEDEAKAETLQKELEQAQRLAMSTAHAYDASVLDPLMRAVPDAERAKILDAIEPGIPGRGQAATQALKILEQVWTEKGRNEARKILLNDQAFIKEVLARYGGQHVEPDAIPAVAAQRPAGFNMNDWIRDQGSRVRSR
jgi:hypothetical protein